MSDPNFDRFVGQPAKIEFNVYEVTQIAGALSLQVAKSSGRILFLGGLFVTFNVITLGLLKKPLRPLALSFMRDAVKKDAAIALLNKISRTMLTGIDGRPTVFGNAMKEIMEAQKKK